MPLWLSCLSLGILATAVPLAHSSGDSSAPDSNPARSRPAARHRRGGAARWHLIWRDEFDGAHLDESKWSQRGLGPRESSIIAADCVTLDGHGLLQLWVKDRGGVLQNAMIGTQQKFEARFGIMASRIRFPRQQGRHGSFWMQPAVSEKVSDDPARSGAEIDIIEWFGAGRRAVALRCLLARRRRKTNPRGPHGGPPQPASAGQDLERRLSRPTPSSGRRKAISFAWTATNQHITEGISRTSPNI